GDGRPLAGSRRTSPLVCQAPFAGAPAAPIMPPRAGAASNLVRMALQPLRQSLPVILQLVAVAVVDAGIAAAVAAVAWQRRLGRDRTRIVVGVEKGVQARRAWGL